MKKCKICNQTKPLSEFPKHSKMKDGYKNQCKVCIALRNKKYYTKPNIVKHRKTLNALPKNKLKQKAYQKEYHNRPDIIQRRKETHRTYKQANKAKRRATKLNATLKGFDKELKLVYAKCPKNHHVHHIIPLREFSDTVSGLHVPWNLEILTKEEHLKAHEKLKKSFKV